MKEKEDYVNLEVAKLLKKKGFDEPCEKMVDINTGYSCCCDYDHICVKNSLLKKEFISYPTLYDAQKWLREKHNIHITIGNSASGYWFELSKADNGTTIYDFNYSGPNDGGKWDTYEGALETGIMEALKRI